MDGKIRRSSWFLRLLNGRKATAQDAIEKSSMAKTIAGRNVTSMKGSPKGCPHRWAAAR